MKLYLIQGEHRIVPGTRKSLAISQTAADEIAWGIVKELIADESARLLEYQTLPPDPQDYTASRWKEAMHKLAEAMLICDHDVKGAQLIIDSYVNGIEGALDDRDNELPCVWIEEIDLVQLPDLPAVLKSLFDATAEMAELLLAAIDLHIYGPGEEPEGGSPERKSVDRVQELLVLAGMALNDGLLNPAYVLVAAGERMEDGLKVIGPLTPGTPRIAIGVQGGCVQWVLGTAPVKVQVIDFDIDTADGGAGDFKLIDDGRNPGAGRVWEESVEIRPAYFDMLDNAPDCHGDGSLLSEAEITAADETDQVADPTKWMVTGELLIPGPAGQIVNFTGYFDAADAAQADRKARAVIEARYIDGTRAPTLTTVPPREKQ